MLEFPRRLSLTIIVLGFTICTSAQQPELSGTFVLHKFAKAIGGETYAIELKKDTYTMTSHFLFTDRDSPVPLETTFTARTDGMVPVSYRPRAAPRARLKCRIRSRRRMGR